MSVLAGEKNELQLTLSLSPTCTLHPLSYTVTHTPSVPSIGLVTASSVLAAEKGLQQVERDLASRESATEGK